MQHPEIVRVNELNIENIESFDFNTELKTLLDQEKLIILNSFSFSHNMFKSRLLLMFQISSVLGKSLQCKGNYGRKTYVSLK